MGFLLSLLHTVQSIGRGPHRTWMEQVSSTVDNITPSPGESPFFNVLTIAAIEALPGPATQTSAFIAETDAVYEWTPGSVAVVDNWTVLSATGGTPGRWIVVDPGFGLDVQPFSKFRVNLNVAGLAAVTALDDTKIANGSTVFASFGGAGRYFRLDTTSALTVDGITILATNSGTGRWVWLNIPMPEWAVQTTWVVNTATGVDTNTGVDNANALLTGAELGRRLSGQVINQKTDCTVTGNQPAGDIIDIDARFTTNGSFYIHGTATTSFTPPAGGFTAVTAISRAAGGGNPLLLTDGNLAAANSWTALVNGRGRITSGARAEALFWVGKDLGAKQARVSPAGTFNTATSPIPVGYTQVLPVNGDPWVIETLPTWPRIRIRGENAADALTVNTVGIQICIDSVDFTSAGKMVLEGTCNFAMVGCDNVQPSQFGPSTIFCSLSHVLNGTFGANVDGASLANYAYLGCLHTGRVTVQSAAIVLFDGDTYAQGVALFRARLSGEVRAGNCCAFDSNTDGIQVSADGVVRNDNPLGLYGSTIYGSGNTSSGLNCQGHFTYLTGTRPTITGGTADFTFSSLTTVPPWSSTTTLYLTTTTTTWAHLAAAEGAGTGFGDHVSLPSVQAVIQGVAAFL